MAIVVKPNTFTAGQAIIASQHNANFDDIYDEFNGAIDNDNIDNAAQIALSKINLTGSNIGTAAVEYVIDGGGSVITTGSKGFIEVPFACMITSFAALADTTGSISIDIKKCTYAAFPTTASIISGGTTITAGVSTQNTLLTNWATGTSAGSILEFYASGCTDLTRVTVSLKVAKL
jgi:hypothetical protein